MGPETNLLSQLNYVFKLSKTPNVEYLVQQVSIPGLNLGSIETGTPFVPIQSPGQITYDQLRVTFKVGENLSSYLEIYKWMEALGRPDSYDQYEYTETDATVIILSSSKRPILNVKFVDVFPVSLSGLDFDSTIDGISYVTCDVNFAFDRMYFTEF